MRGKDLPDSRVTATATDTPPLREKESKEQQTTS